MTSDHPVPPSIPPRKNAGRPGPRPSMATPRIVTPTQHEPSTPSATPAPAAKPTPASLPVPPTLVRPAAPTAPADPVTAPGGAEAVPAASPVTSALSSAYRRASTAVAGATAAVGAEFSRIAKPTTDTDGSPSPSPKADPTIAATETQTAAGAPRTAAATAARPVPRATASAGTPPTSAARDGAPRRVRLAVSRIDPWSVMKLAFLLSVAIGIMIVVAAAVVWFVLDGLAVFTTANDMITEIAGAESSLNILQYVEFSRVVSGATVIAVVDVVLLTALSTIGAFLYNITAALVGGVNLTLTDD